MSTLPVPSQSPAWEPMATPRRRFSARASLALGFASLAVLGTGLFGWGALASISGAVIASGRVEVATRDQVVEHAEGGSVREILVRNGDRVSAGAVLVRLDDTMLRSEEAILISKLVDLVARRNRLEAEFRGADTIDWDTALVRRAAVNREAQAILDGQQRLFEARHASREGQEAQLRERLGQMRKQVASLVAQGEAVAIETGFIARELEAERELFRKRMTEIRSLLELEREAARLAGQAGDIEARIAAARGRIAEIEIQILQVGTRRVEEAESQAREAQANEFEVRERLASVRERLKRMAVRAPVSGEVFNMQVFAEDEVVRPGEPIAQIVPRDADLVVRAQLDPIHVDQVHPGQEAVLLFSAFPARSTPEFAGRVVHVAADARHDQRSELSWYEVEVEMGAAVAATEDIAVVAWAGTMYERLSGRLRALAGSPAPLPAQGAGSAGVRSGLPAVPAPPVHARDLALLPGMPVEVHIRTGERSPLSYLAKPLTDYFVRSLREE